MLLSFLAVLQSLDETAALQAASSNILNSDARLESAHVGSEWLLGLYNRMVWLLCFAECAAWGLVRPDWWVKLQCYICQECSISTPCQPTLVC
jgi:hypothetical protein